MQEVAGNRECWLKKVGVRFTCPEHVEGSNPPSFLPRIKYGINSSRNPEKNSFPIIRIVLTISFITVQRKGIRNV